MSIINRTSLYVPITNNVSNNLNRKVKCYFKRAYTTKTFTTNINPCQSRESLYNQIFYMVNMHLFPDNPLENKNEFEVSVAGTNLAEEAPGFPPNNVCIKNTVDFIDYNSTYAFYIKKREPIELHECPICYYTRTQLFSFNCIHGFCQFCTNNWITSCDQQGISCECPMCRSNLREINNEGRV